LVKGAPDVRSAGTDWYYDFSADGIKRSIAESLKRLQLDRVDILYIHDADDYVDQAVAEAWPVIEQLRSEGVVRAVCAGNTTVPTLLRFARETTMDFFLVAGRYTMLADDAQDELLPLCIEKGIGIVIAQALHGGLIDGVADPQLYYQPTDDATKAKVARIAAICHAYGVPTAAAAIQFPLAHPAVAGVLTGPETAEQLRGNLEWVTTDVPVAIWAELKAEGLLRQDAVVPGA
ncbi:MAG TPA: aldo/keto reductase, partial [Thermomicrobiales bacterium]|nr:aldo/keto reductase [Thermomicrobiales bacterium]